jgi:hypothetical protein
VVPPVAAPPPLPPEPWQARRRQKDETRAVKRKSIT